MLLVARSALRAVSKGTHLRLGHVNERRQQLQPRLQQGGHYSELFNEVSGSRWVPGGAGQGGMRAGFRVRIPSRHHTRCIFVISV